jgi:hypothetical protein
MWGLASASFPSARSEGRNSLEAAALGELPARGIRRSDLCTPSIRTVAIKFVINRLRALLFSILPHDIEYGRGQSPLAKPVPTSNR